MQQNQIHRTFITFLNKYLHLYQVDAEIRATCCVNTKTTNKFLINLKRQTPTTFAHPINPRLYLFTIRN